MFIDNQIDIIQEISYQSSDKYRNIFFCKVLHIIDFSSQTFGQLIKWFILLLNQNVSVYFVSREALIDIEILAYKRLNTVRKRKYNITTKQITGDTTFSDFSGVTWFFIEHLIILQAKVFLVNDLSHILLCKIKELIGLFKPNLLRLRKNDYPII